jgi:hypothetical protein
MTKGNLTHFLFYFLLTFFLGLATSIVLAAPVIFVFGIAKEVIYDQANEGVSDLYNILANPLGISAGWLLLTVS